MKNWQDHPEYQDLTPADFEFTQVDEKISDEKLATKPVSYFQDAWRRFKRNSASVTAAIIILILVIYAIFAPIFSEYSVSFRENIYRKTLPKSSFFAKFGFWDGAKKRTMNENAYSQYRAIGQETGVDPIVEMLERKIVISRRGRKKIRTRYYTGRVDAYSGVGCIYKNMTQGEFNQLCKWQDMTGLQVIYPAVDSRQMDLNVPQAIAEDANIWYKVNAKGEPVRDKDGNLQPIYKTGDPGTYDSLRIPSDPGDYQYYNRTQTGYTVRVYYPLYFQYIYSDSNISTDREIQPEDEFYIHEPARFLFGTNQYGQDIWTCLASGARFSFLLAIFVSTVNILIGAVIGALEGYYGGAFDLIMERINEVLGGVPFIITVTLFQLHLAKKVGPVVSLLFAFFLTGWIGMAGLVRTQFYRFKHQEYVLSARTLGASDSRIIRKHIFPNAIGTIITSTVLTIPGVIFQESSLSYLGIVNLSSSTTTSVGTLLSGGHAYLSDFPHIIFFPSVFIALLQISFNLFGNGLRDAFNPSMRGADE